MIFKQIRDEDRKSFEKKPFIELSDSTMKTRRNLLLISFFGFVMLYYDVKVIATRTPLFFIEGLSTNEVTSILSILLGYFLVVFTWASWNEVIKWRLRLTIGYPQTDKNQVGLRILKCLDQEPQYHAGKIKNAIDSVRRQAQTEETEIAQPEQQSQKDEWISGWKFAVEEDLKRIEYFEQWFWAYGKQQRLKFFFIDIGLPIFFGSIVFTILVK